MGLSTAKTVASGKAVETSVACDLDDGADHYVYADPNVDEESAR